MPALDAQQFVPNHSTPHENLKTHTKHETKNKKRYVRSIPSLLVFPFAALQPRPAIHTALPTSFPYSHRAVQYNSEVHAYLPTPVPPSFPPYTASLSNLVFDVLVGLRGPMVEFVRFFRGLAPGLPELRSSLMRDAGRVALPAQFERQLYRPFLSQNKAHKTQNTQTTRHTQRHIYTNTPQGTKEKKNILLIEY